MVRHSCSIALAILTLLLVHVGQAAESELKTDDQKTVYTLGLLMAESLKPLALSPSEVVLVLAGVKDGAKDKGRLDVIHYRGKVQQLVQNRAKAKGEGQKKETPGAASGASKAKAQATGEVELKTEEQQTLYAVGLVLAQGLKPYTLAAAETPLVEEGVRDGLAGKPRVDVAQYRTKVQELGNNRIQAKAADEKKEAQKFLDAMASQKGAQKLSSGLIFIEIVPGEGASPEAKDSVEVQYHGTLRDGTVFDSSRERGTPVTFPLDRVIPCWTEALQKMKVGGKAKLVCPSDLAYGDRGAPPSILPGAALVFEVELLDIQKAAAAPPAAKP